MCLVEDISQRCSSSQEAVSVLSLMVNRLDVEHPDVKVGVHDAVSTVPLETTCRCEALVAALNASREKPCVQQAAGMLLAVDTAILGAGLQAELRSSALA
jgi:hypothetical protein